MSILFSDEFEIHSFVFFFPAGQIEIEMLQSQQNRSLLFDEGRQFAEHDTVKP